MRIVPVTSRVQTVCRAMRQIPNDPPAGLSPTRGKVSGAPPILAECSANSSDCKAVPATTSHNSLGPLSAWGHVDHIVITRTKCYQRG